MKSLLIKKVLFGIFFILILFLGIVFFVGRHFFQGMDMISLCGETVKHVIVSPNKKYVATVYVRNCGTTTDYVTHLNLRNAGDIEKPNAQGVITIGEVFTVRGKQNIEATWKDNANLEIQLLENHASILLTDGGIWNSVHIQIKK
ncbi:DUF5412 family protein [Sulfurirhabdus autotrophica]|uniref:Uncharacterized protein n=1 Tax=Sulfurirhabdus autotrophica TaxID=1706046 RepID=A0A4V2W0M3_9PROT|nr:DUF5412 family protein [Sulfurirhabdus autotrophica]TCV77552.1 hypothetical protein EDC63_1482 [Sulfurirhabdus autotrophica]